MFQEPSCSSCSLACGAARPQLGTGTGSSSNCSQRDLQGEGKAWGLGGWVPYGCSWARPHCQGREHPWERKLATDNIWGSACGTSCGTSLWHVPWHTAPAQHEQSLPSSWGVGQGCCGSTEVLGKESCPRRLRRDECLWYQWDLCHHQGWQDRSAGTAQVPATAEGDPLQASWGPSPSRSHHLSHTNTI